MERLYVKIADTPYKQAEGLMFVKNMEQDRGMLFVFSRNQELRFWGENTFIPLDIAFVDSDGIIRKISKISPLSKKVVSCSVPCKYAVETNDGYFAEKGIEVGCKMMVHQEGNSGYLTFAQPRRNSERKMGSAWTRPIIAQLMNDDYYSPQEQPPQQQEAEPNVPSLSKNDIWQYLEDDFDKPEQPEVEPGEKEKQEQEDVGEYPLEPEEKPQSEFEFPQFDNVFDATEWAQQNNEVMRISYTTQHGTGVVRDVEPHGQFYAGTTGRQILVTFDETVGDIRAFILKNIKSFAFTGDRFEPKFRVV